MKTTTTPGAAKTFGMLPSLKTMPAAELASAISRSVNVIRSLIVKAEQSSGIVQLDAQCEAQAERRRLAAYLKAAKARKLQFVAA